ncbi:hypothetical protein [Eudoraea chungangensis]|uniref:hypothetical protein n=1 Tax=Eudoraea chungangensis TaxID=1481905 RepID=UPI0023EC3E7C|nr:hypothetical protein [Eudoraea chungangensis]
MALETVNIWCWIIPLLVGVISAVFGFLIGKSQPSNSLELNELEALRREKANWHSSLEDCKRNLEAANIALQEKKDFPFNQALAKSIFGKSIRKDDLKIVEGIGPKIEGLFHNYDIRTWQELSLTSVKKCQDVLDSGGDRFKVHDPASWPMQAKMCYEGKWKELFKWQEEHKHGKL